MTDTSTTLLVDGLDPRTTEETLRATFNPFTSDREVIVRLLHTDETESKNSLQALVTYDSPYDAEAAMDNMDRSEVDGKVIKVKIDTTKRFFGQNQAVWDNDEWLQQHTSKENDTDKEEGDDAEEAEA